MIHLILLLVIWLLTWCVASALGYKIGQDETRMKAQQMLDAWAADTGSPRIRLNWEDDDCDLDQ